MEQIHDIIERLRIAVDDRDWSVVEEVVETLEEIDTERQTFIDANYFTSDE